MYLDSTHLLVNYRLTNALSSFALFRPSPSVFTSPPPPSLCLLSLPASRLRPPVSRRVSPFRCRALWLRTCLSLDAVRTTARLFPSPASFSTHALSRRGGALGIKTVGGAVQNLNQNLKWRGSKEPAVVAITPVCVASRAK